MCEIYDNWQPFAAADLNTSGMTGRRSATGCRGEWTLAIQDMAAPQAGLSGRDWMIEKKDQSVKVRAEKPAAEGMMDTPESNKVNPNVKAPAVQDRWFDTQLSRMYADLAAEPVPKDMLSLLDKLKTNKSQ
jgi:hypothetical protein